MSNPLKYPPDKDDLCEYLNNLYGFDGVEKSWLHLHVDRIDSLHHKGDNFYFHPDGYRFRSKQEIEKWRGLGSDPNQLSLFKCAFVRDPKEYGGLGITKRQAELSGKIQLSLMPVPSINLHRPKRKRASDSDDEFTTTTDDDEEEGNHDQEQGGKSNTTRDTNRTTVYSPFKKPQLNLQVTDDNNRNNHEANGSSSSSSSSSHLPFLPGLSYRHRKDHPTAASLCNVHAYKTSDMPILSVYQKDQWLGDMRITHSMGHTTLRNSLPSQIHIYQRTSYYTVYELGTKYFLEALAYAVDPKGLKNAPAATSNSNETFQGQILIGRLEILRSQPLLTTMPPNTTTTPKNTDNSTNDTSSSSSLSSNMPSPPTAPVVPSVTELSTNSSFITSLVPTGTNVLENTFINLNLKGRVSYCQTICNNNHLFIIPRTYVVPPPPAKPTENITHPAIVQDYLRYIFNCSDQIQVPSMPRSEDAFLIFVMRNPTGRTLMNTPGLGEDHNGPLRHIQSNPRTKRVGSITARSTPFPVSPAYADYVKLPNPPGTLVINVTDEDSGTNLSSFSSSI